MTANQEYIYVRDTPEINFKMIRKGSVVIVFLLKMGETHQFRTSDNTNNYDILNTVHKLRQRIYPSY